MRDGTISSADLYASANSADVNGRHELARELRKLAGRTVPAPTSDRSACGAALRLEEGLRVCQLERHGLEVAHRCSTVTLLRGRAVRVDFAWAVQA